MQRTSTLNQKDEKQIQNGKQLYQEGLNFYLGQNGVQKNQDQAIKKFIESAECQEPEAQFQLACIYQNGEGVDVDKEVSRNYFFMAAEQKHSDSLYFLGKIYQTGNGVLVDNKKAQDYIKQAAELGNDSALNELESKTYKTQNGSSDMKLQSDMDTNQIKRHEIQNKEQSQGACYCLIF